VAFFGLLYYAALRPEEAVNIRETNLILPASGWGDLLLEEATPDAGSDWTDSGTPRDRRPLKHRAEDEPRKVPCPPELTALLHRHMERFGTSVDGKLFWGVRSKKALDSSTYERIWTKARARALTPQQAASPLAKRPYDLRHAAVSTWLNAGVAPQQVAEWAGHSVDVLLRVYAKCLDGTEHEARRRVESALKSKSPRGHRRRG
jgi:integrase